MGKTALYIRVSTDAQFEEGYSVDAQKEKLEQYCKLKDISDYEFYVDGGWSGSNIERPEMKRMITDIKNREISAVIVYKLDRLSRSQKDTVFLLEDIFNPNECNFISLNENFDTTTPYGKAMIGILSVFAQLERENIRERTRMGMYERVKSGLWMGGGRIPFGYDYDKNSEVTKKFYSFVQNKLHFAVTGKTAAELIYERANSEQPAMGLTTWKDAPNGKILKRDIGIAKNYLNEKELSRLNRLVTMFIDYAELMAEDEILMSMQDWVEQTNQFLINNRQKVLDGKGKISHDTAMQKAEKEYEVFRVKQDREYVSEFDREVEKYLKG